MQTWVRTLSLFLGLGLGLALAAKPESRLPLVGVLAQYCTKQLEKAYPFPPLSYTYVAGSYVDWVGLAGAMPVLIPFDSSRENLDFLLGAVDALLIPGGSAPLKFGDRYSDYMESIDYVVGRAEQINDGGRYFPVWATCNGFEALMVRWAGSLGVLACDFDDIYRDHPVLPAASFPQSKFWGQLDQSRMHAFFARGFAFYDHKCAVSPAAFTQFGLAERVLLLATSDTDSKRTFVAMAEDRRYPFFAVQWHPEKNLFERGPRLQFLDRSTDTVKLLSEIVHKLVDSVRAGAKPLSQVPDSIKPYFSSFQTPVIASYSGYERLYLMPRLAVPLQADSPTACPDPGQPPTPNQPQKTGSVAVDASEERVNTAAGA